MSYIPRWALSNYTGYLGVSAKLCEGIEAWWDSSLFASSKSCNIFLSCPEMTWKVQAMVWMNPLPMIDKYRSLSNDEDQLEVRQSQLMWDGGGPPFLFQWWLTWSSCLEIWSWKIPKMSVKSNSERFYCGSLLCQILGFVGFGHINRNFLSWANLHINWFSRYVTFASEVVSRV